MSNENKGKIITQCNERMDALRKYVQARAEIPVDGATQTATQLIDMYQASVDAHIKVESKRAEVKAALTERRAIDAARRKRDRALRSWVVNMFGANSQEAHDFGFPPPKPRPVKADRKAIAAAKRLATRKARHTQGKRQKADIHGVVQELVLVPGNPSTGTSTASNAAPSSSNGASAPSNGASVTRAPTAT